MIQEKLEGARNFKIEMENPNISIYIDQSDCMNGILSANQFVRRFKGCQNSTNFGYETNFT